MPKVCRSCCGCVADAAHVCICDCLDPWPKTLYTADGNGTHSLTWNGATMWTGLAYMNSVATRCYSGLSACFSTTQDNWFYSIRLRPVCVGPKSSWYLELSIVFPYITCPNGPGSTSATYYKSEPTPATPPIGCLEGFDVTLSDQIEFTCDYSLLTFSLPTSIGDLATPGGGGTMTVTP